MDVPRESEKGRRLGQLAAWTAANNHGQQSLVPKKPRRNTVHVVSPVRNPAARDTKAAEASQRRISKYSRCWRPVNQNTYTYL